MTITTASRNTYGWPKQCSTQKNKAGTVHTSNAHPPGRHQPPLASTHDGRDIVRSPLPPATGRPVRTHNARTYTLTPHDYGGVERQRPKTHAEKRHPLLPTDTYRGAIPIVTRLLYYKLSATCVPTRATQSNIWGVAGYDRGEAGKIASVRPADRAISRPLQALCVLLLGNVPQQHRR